jgi:uncharacterized Zn finger protein
MEVIHQKCQECGSIELEDILVRERGRATMVFVRCAKCEELVARYRLRDYYHHGKGVESYLRSMGATASDSAREHLEEFQRAKEETTVAYEQVLELLREQGEAET